jgi:FixJ family two-component response regulator
MMRESPIVYLVDDDASILRSLTRLLKLEGFKVQAFSSPRDFLNEHDSGMAGCIVVDLAMPELNGLDLQKMLTGSGHSKPVVFITGQADVQSTVKAMKAGAVDFLTKPFSDHAFLNAVREAINKDEASRERFEEREDSERRLELLTAREREVFERVITGKLNKQIAVELGIVEKTVKVHRGRMMKKMGVRSLAKLARIAERLGLMGND